jgi:pyridoxamine 5'-phosphate oxidase
MDLHNVRESYKFDSLLEENLHADPMDQFHFWYEAYKSLQIKDVNAMILSTIGLDGFPKSRVVLLKEVREDEIVFFSNYQSAKGQEIEANPKVSINFFWREHERQVRFQGKATKISADESQKYFVSRPYLSQVGALASDQSEIISSRLALEEKFANFMKQHPEGTQVPMPNHWGGYAIKIESAEFWQGREGRLHDRIKFTRSPEGGWMTVRLQP